MHILLLGVVVIFSVGWLFTSDIFLSVDLLFWDEANYMKSGMAMPEKFNRAWGPSYAVWYKLLSFLESDTIRLYYLNYRLMTILPAVALFVFFALSNIRLWVSFSLGLLFLFASLNLPVWPKISHYALFVFMLGMILMKYIPNYLVKISFISVFALFISYSRPEFYLSYLGLLALWIVALCFRQFRSRPAIIWSVVFLLIGFSAQYLFKNPLFNFQGDRSALAFAQHFMFNYFTWNEIDQDFWITWMPYYDELFGNAASIKEIYAVNSQMFYLHFLTNFQNYFIKSFHLFSDAMLPEALVNIPIKGRIAILLIGTVIMMTLVSFNHFFSNLIRSLRKNALVLLVLFIFIAPSLISCFVIYPRDHYMIFHYFFILFFASVIIFFKPKGSPVYDKYSFIFSILVLFIVYWLMPSTQAYDHFDLWRKEKSQANLKTVEALRAYEFTDSIRIVENEGGINLFLNDNYIWIRGFMKDTSWTSYIENEKVDIIYVTPSLVKYPSLKSDTSWVLFERNPEIYGFEKVLTGNHQPYLYIKKNLLQVK